MKKLLSVLLAVMMTVSVCAITAIPAIAAESPTASQPSNNGPTTQVNGSNNDKDVHYTPDPNNSSEITFEYTGDGTLTGWNDNLDDLGLVEGTDYTKVENPDGTLTITFLTQAAKDMFDNGDVVVNALVKFDTTTTTGKPNGSSTSPATGVTTSIIAGSVAVAGAGIAVLAATKKKDAE